jgi:hypothetical protein
MHTPTCKHTCTNVCARNQHTCVRHKDHASACKYVFFSLHENAAYKHTHATFTCVRTTFRHTMYKNAYAQAVALSNTQTIQGRQIDAASMQQLSNNLCCRCNIDATCAGRVEETHAHAPCTNSFTCVCLHLPHESCVVSRGR